VFADKKLKNLKAAAFIPNFGKCTGLSVPFVQGFKKLTEIFRGREI